MKHLKIFEEYNSDNNNSKDMYVNYDFSIDLDPEKGVYIADEKAIIGAYMITNQDDKFIEIMNIRELESTTAFYMDNSNAYSVTIHNEKLPKSKVEIVSAVTGMEDFFYIKMPYWLYKETPGLNIKKCTKNFNMKRLSLRDRDWQNKELMQSFKDDNVVKYFKQSNPDERTLFLADMYNGKNKSKRNDDPERINKVQTLGNR